ncbi:MAG: membrane protein insertion efficiency factor YidD [Nitrospiraceae bacterium]|nr:membrane protein insertion efficiency factor YidD [Nitrospiraceae bacterium]
MEQYASAAAPRAIRPALLVRWLFIGVIGAYRLCVSPLLAPACRFHPTCSAYAQQAIDRYGVWRGSVLAARRLVKCHPFHPGGVDPVM